MTVETSSSDQTLRSIGLTVASVMIFGFQDAVAKILVQDYSPFYIAMMRYWAFAAVSLYLVSRQAPLRYAFRSRLPGWQIARGMLLMVDIWLFAFAVKTVPLGELAAITMIYPLLVTLFAIPLLGEKVGLFRLSAVLAGFAGALIILRPGGLPYEWGTLFAVATTVVYALYVVATRKVAQADSTATNMVYVGCVGLVMSSAVGMFFVQPMDAKGLLLLAVIIVTTITAHGLMMKALSYAPASVLQPFNYLALPWAIVLSVVIFSHLIDPVSLVGAIIITAAGLTVWARERRRKTRPVNPEAAKPGA